MGLFDGTIRSFATKLTTYLEDRAVTLEVAGNEHRDKGEQYEVMRNFVAAFTLRELAKAIAYVSNS